MNPFRFPGWIVGLGSYICFLYGGWFSMAVWTLGFFIGMWVMTVKKK